MDYQADFRHESHDLRDEPAFSGCLDPDSYTASQQLGRALLHGGSAGIVYPSVRHAGGVCLACFRPPLVLNVREGAKVKFTFTNGSLTNVVAEN